MLFILTAQKDVDDYQLAIIDRYVAIVFVSLSSENIHYYTPQVA